MQLLWVGIALRRGTYKLLHFAEHDEVELYNVSTDISEQHDLSKELPKVTAQLQALLQQQLNMMGARRAVPRKTSLP